MKPSSEKNFRMFKFLIFWWIFENIFVIKDQSFLSVRQWAHIWTQMRLENWAQSVHFERCRPAFVSFKDQQRHICSVWRSYTAFEVLQLPARLFASKSTLRLAVDFFLFFFIALAFYFILLLLIICYFCCCFV